MLSKPGVSELTGKVGNRYEVALAVAKRAREIADERLESGDETITDPVDVASVEIDEGVVTISKESLDIKDELVDEIVDAETISTKIRSKKKAEELSKIAEGLVEDLKIDDEDAYIEDEEDVDYEAEVDEADEEEEE